MNADFDSLFHGTFFKFPNMWQWHISNETPLRKPANNLILLSQIMFEHLTSNSYIDTIVYLHALIKWVKYTRIAHQKVCSLMIYVLAQIRWESHHHNHSSTELLSMKKWNDETHSGKPQNEFRMWCVLIVNAFDYEICILLQFFFSVRLRSCKLERNHDS